MSDDALSPATRRDCADEASLTSETSDQPAFLRFKNTSSDTVTANWINYGGDRDLRSDQKDVLSPGEHADRYTYITHPFVVLDARGECLAIFLPTMQPSIAIIDDASSSQ